MFCPNCGNENPDDARFCGKCGTPLPVMEEEHRNQDKEATPAADTVKMISNTESWKVEPANQSIRDADPAPGRNPYYIPPATVLPKTGSQEEEAAENNTALIIIIIVLITLIILVGIFAFAYMRGYIDF